MNLIKPVIFVILIVLICGVLAVFATNSSNNDLNLSTLNMADTTVPNDNDSTEDNTVQQEPVNQNNYQANHSDKQKQEWIVCQECGGTGVCWGCNGTGVIYDPDYYGDDKSHVCPACEGSTKCPACQGTGMEPANQWTGTYPG